MAGWFCSYLHSSLVMQNIPQFTWWISTYPHTHWMKQLILESKSVIMDDHVWSMVFVAWLQRRNTAVSFQKVQVSVNGWEETGIAAYWVCDRIDRCHVGYCPLQDKYYWVIVQVKVVFSLDHPNATVRKNICRNLGSYTVALISI